MGVGTLTTTKTTISDDDVNYNIQGVEGLTVTGNRGLTSIESTTTNNYTDGGLVDGFNAAVNQLFGFLSSQQAQQADIFESLSLSSLASANDARSDAFALVEAARDPDNAATSKNLMIIFAGIGLMLAAVTIAGKVKK